MFSRSTVSRALAFVAIALLSVPAGARSAKAPVLAPDKLVVLSTTDVKGKTSPCGCHIPKGGLSRLGSYADSIRSEYGQVLQVDAGGYFPEMADSVYRKTARFMMDGFRRVGVEVAGVGDRDLKFGIDFLRDNARASGLQLVCANLYDRQSKKPALAPFVLRQVGNVKVGVVGVLSDKVDLGPSRDGLETRDPLPATREAVAAARKAGASVVVLVSQLGKVESEDLVTAVDGVDLLIAGRNVPLLPRGRVVKNTLTVYGGEQGQYIGRAILTVDGAGKPTASEAETFILSPEVGEKEDVLRDVKSFEDAINAQVKAKENERLKEDREKALEHSSLDREHYVGDAMCARCHAKEAEQWKTTAHANAWASLVSTKKDASAECVSCHVVGFRQAGGFTSGTESPQLANVQCESCHGMGTEHDAFSNATAAVSEATCRGCHDAKSSPDFDFATYRTYVDHTRDARELPALQKAGGAMKPQG